MGWGPCLSYTAPVLLPYIGATRVDWRSGLQMGAMFTIGKIVALAILGGLATVAFQSINHLFPPHRSGYLYLLAAAVIITLGVLIILGKQFKLLPEKQQKPTNFSKDMLTVLFLGFLYGITPCVPLIAILTYIACIAENIAVGVLYAVVFTISTAIPLLVLAAAAGLIPQKLLASARARRRFQAVCGGILILFGAHLIYSVLYFIA